MSEFQLAQIKYTPPKVSAPKRIAAVERTLLVFALWIPVMLLTGLLGLGGLYEVSHLGLAIVAGLWLTGFPSAVLILHKKFPSRFEF